MKREIGTGMKRRQSMKRIKYLLGLLVMFAAFGIITCVYAGSAEAHINLEIMQTITAENTDRTDLDGSYIMTAETDGAPMPEGAVDGKLNFNMTGEKTSKVLDIGFTQPGEYHYQIRRDSSVSDKGYTYDETVFNVIVYAGYNNGDFSAEVKVHRGTSENKVPQIIFEHKYSPSGVCESDPPVKKVVEGTPKESSVFEFTMTASDKSSPMPEGSEDGVKTVQIKGSGEDEFGVVKFTAPGKYLYTISEVNTGVEGYTYDKMAYTLKCTVVDDNGVLKLTERMVDASGNEVKTAAFTNTYKAQDGDNGGNKSDTPGASQKNSSGSTKASRVKTGDNTNIIGFVVLLLVALGAGSVVYVRKRRNR